MKEMLHVRHFSFHSPNMLCTVFNFQGLWFCLLACSLYYNGHPPVSCVQNGCKLWTITINKQDMSTPPKLMVLSVCYTDNICSIIPTFFLTKVTSSGCVHHPLLQSLYPIDFHNYIFLVPGQIFYWIVQYGVTIMVVLKNSLSFYRVICINL